MSRIRLVSMLLLKVCALSYDLRNSNVFSARLKVYSDINEVIAGGSMFQTLAAATEAWSPSPMILWNYRGTCTTLSMKIASVHGTQCRQPVVAHWRGSVVLYNDKLKRQGGSRIPLEPQPVELLKKRRHVLT